MNIKAVYLAIIIVIAGATSATIIPTSPKVISIPAKVDVNGIQWNIQIVDSINGFSSNIVGYTDCSIKRLYIIRTAYNPHEVIIHELSHAAICRDDFTIDNMYYNSSTNMDHEGIYKFANIWSELLKRNPDLAAYLAQN